MGLPTPQTTGFLFVAVAVLILSAVMLQGRAFGKVTAVAGLLAGILAIADFFLAIFAPVAANLLLMIGSLIWAVCWIMISRRLLHLGGIGVYDQPGFEGMPEIDPANCAEKWELLI